MQDFNEETPKVTICVITYNHERFIEACLKSILNQSYENIEILVVDDCSMDQTVLLAKQTLEKTKNSKIISFEAREGITATANYALSKANGDFVKIFAGDDYYKPEGVKRQVKALQQNPDASLCYANMQWAWRGILNIPIKISHYGGFQKRSETAQCLLDDHTMSTPTLLFRRSKIRNLRFNPKLPYINDLMFLLECLKTGPAVFCDYTAVQYNRHEFNVSRLQSFFHDRIKLREILKEDGSWYKSIDFTGFDRLILYSRCLEVEEKKNMRKLFLLNLKCSTNMFISVKWFLRVLLIWANFFSHRNTR